MSNASLTDSVLQTLSKPCDCVGDCTAILKALTESLGLPRRCELCNTPEPEVKLHLIGGKEWLCFHCAQELYS
jgi:hypothetical protein